MEKGTIQRNQELDIVKGIVILLVVVGHCTQLLEEDSIVLTLIYGFHMPLFVYVSGVTFRYSMENKYFQEPKRFWRDKFYSIIRPYFIVSFLTLFISPMLFGRYYTGEVQTILVGQACPPIIIWFNYPMWFLTMLFCAETIFFFVLRATKGNEKLSLLVSMLCSLVGYVMMQNEVVFIWNIDVALFVAPLLWMGYFLYPRIDAFRERLSNTKLIISVVLASILYVVIALLNGKVDLNTRLVNNIILYIICFMLGIYITFAVSKLLGKVKMLNLPFKHCGENSMAILCWHLPCGYIYFWCMVPLFTENTINICYGVSGKFLAVLIYLIFVIPMSLMLHRIVFPKLKA